jgi:hypothetical protein
MKRKKHICISPIFLQTAWMMVAAFGTYFCTYALRKPFTTGMYANQYLGPFSFKSVLILAQVIGYMFSKVIGIRVISSIEKQNRILLLALFFGISLFSLLLFGLYPGPLQVVFLFLNGLPLGMMYGLIFHYLEGRKTTEIVGIALSINLVLTSGVLKTTYLILQKSWNISETWLPFVIGGLATPFFILFLWMLTRIEEPNEADRRERVKRIPMTKATRKALITQLGTGIFLVSFIYTFLTVLRDFRDNFSIEIWKEQSFQPIDSTLFARYETWIALIVFVSISLLAYVRNNLRAFQLNSLLLFGNFVLLYLSTWLFIESKLPFTTWYILSGISLFLPYLLIQVTFFERLLALFHCKGNVGFMVYISDSLGYLGSVLLMFGREVGTDKTTSFTQILTSAFLYLSLIGVFLTIAQFFFFQAKIFSSKKSVSPIIS